MQGHIKAQEEKVQREIDAQHKRQRANMSPSAQADQSTMLKQSTLGKGAPKNTRMPEDARPNPFLTQTYEPIANRLASINTIAAHTRGIGGMALHQRK